MLKRWLPCFVPVLALVLLIPAPVRAGDDPKKDPPPGLIVRVKSVDHLLDSVKLLGDALGQDDLSKKFDELLQLKAGGAGLKGVDRKRPLGIYANLADNLNDSQIVVLVPLTDKKDFVDLVANIGGGKVEVDDDGLHTTNHDAIPAPIFFRFAHKYAYITLGDAKHIEPKTLIAPAKLFPAKQKAGMSLTLRMDQIPKGLRDAFVGGFEQGLNSELEKKNDKENVVENALKNAFAKEMQKKLQSVFNDGTELNAFMDLDSRKKELKAEFTLATKEGSELGKFVQQLGKAKSLFSGLMHKGAALNGLIHFPLPEHVKEALDTMIDEAAKKVVAETQDEKKKAQAALFFKALTPTLKSGEVDVGFSMRGPSEQKLYTLVAGVRLKEGKKLEAVLRELFKDLTEGDKALLKLDLDKVGDVAIHSIDLGKGLDENIKKAFGPGALYFALRDDAVFVGMGENALSALKEALATPVGTGPSPPLMVEMSMAKMMQLIAQTPEQKQIARKAFADGDDGKIRIAVEGGEVLRVRLTMQLSVLRAFALMGQQQQQQQPMKMDD